MRALVFDGREPALRDDYLQPTPGKGEVLVAVRLAGICRTDLEIVKGYMGFRGVMGHEFVGTVVQGPPAWMGKRVVAEINCVCMRCDLCRKGLPTHCRNRTVLGIDRHDGAFADYVVVPEANLHHVPDRVSDEQAVWIEPLAAAFQVLRQVPIDRSQRVVVLGDGRLGQLVARVLRTAAERLTMVGRHAAKLRSAEKQGIAAALAGDFAPQADADVVVDATGTAAGFELAMRIVRPRGTIVLKSTFAADSGMNLAPLVIHEIHVVGSRCGPFQEAIAALAAGTVDVRDIPAKRFPLDRAVEALRAAGDPESIKVVLDVGQLAPQASTC